QPYHYHRRSNLQTLFHSLVKKSFNLAKTEYVKWICNPKMLMFAVMIIFIYDYIIKEMLKAASNMNTGLMILEPFIAICNSTLLLLIMPAVYMALMGDFPKVDGNSMYYIQRVGKQNWMFGQFIFSVMASVTFVVSTVLCSSVCVLGNCFTYNKWSEVATKFVKYNPEQSQSLLAILFTGRLYNNLSPVEAFALSAGLMTLYLILISMLLLMGFTIGKRTAGIAVTGMVICAGSALVEVGSSFKWVFPASHTLPWVHYNLIYNKQYFDIRLSFIYFVVFIIILYLVSSRLIERYDFSKISEMEE
ncbi:MAG: hypothetical protein ACI4EN_06775, partial [Butyrivibrio sp.]